MLAAIVSAAAVLAVGIWTQSAISHRERQTRTYERVRAHLRELLDSCLALRVSVRDYGAAFRLHSGARHADLVQAEHQFDVARERVQAYCTFVDPMVADTVARWMEAAQFRFISTSDVTENEEEERWNELTQVIGTGLHDPDAKIHRTA